MAVVSSQQSKIINKDTSREKPQGRAEQTCQRTAACLSGCHWPGVAPENLSESHWITEDRRYSQRRKNTWWQQSLVEDTHRGTEKQHKLMRFSWQLCAKLSGLKYFCLCTDHEQMQLYSQQLNIPAPISHEYIGSHGKMSCLCCGWLFIMSETQKGDRRGKDPGSQVNALDLHKSNKLCWVGHAH